MTWKGFKDFHATIEISLDMPENDLMNSFHKDTRYCIRKSYKESLEFAPAKTEDWNEFYLIYREVMIRGGSSIIPLEELKARLNFPLFIIKHRGNIIGGIGGCVHNDNTRFGLGIAAINPRYNYTNANYFAYWSLIKYLKNHGILLFDMGGYQLKASGKMRNINKFKEKWNGKIKIYPIYSYNPFYTLGRKAIRNFPILKKINYKKASGNKGRLKNYWRND